MPPPGHSLTASVGMSGALCSGRPQPFETGHIRALAMLSPLAVSAPIKQPFVIITSNRFNKPAILPIKNKRTKTQNQAQKLNILPV
jgi:hypothetical protein